jgi:hypothetical protein
MFRRMFIWFNRWDNNDPLKAHTSNEEGTHVYYWHPVGEAVRSWKARNEGGRWGEEIDTRTYTNNRNEESLSSCSLYVLFTQ